jgi:thioredoxin 1
MGTNVQTFTDESFETDVLKDQLPVLVDFWAEWCGPCRALAPTIEELAQSYSGRLKVGKLNVDDNQRTAERYGIRSIPTLLLFKDGQVAAQQVGALPKASLERLVTDVLNRS